MEKTKIINLLAENKYSPIASKIAPIIGLQTVNRNGKVYLRRKPERLTGKALESALAFGQINHNNRGKSGVILLPNGDQQNKVAFDSSREFKGTVFKKTLTEREKIEKLLNEL